jgi:acyl dehydratase
MRKRTLSSSPSILPLYARAAAPMIPGASLLPFVPGRGKEIPDVELTLPDVEADPDAVAAYAKVCGFSLRGTLPATYPHVLAFPLHMAVMADGSFPFGAVGLVHVENRIVQHRPIAVDEQITLRVRATKLEPHPKGRTFSIVSEAHVGAEKVWEGLSTMLRRGGGSGGPEARKAEARPNGGVPGELPAGAEWRLGGDLGRRYAAVSGDRNPIHMHPLTAKPLGFPRAIAHGMWTKARCLAALESGLPDAFTVDVGFRRPILLPGKVAFASERDGDAVRFAVRDAGKGTLHLDGQLQPTAANTKTSTTGRKRAS